MKAITFLGASRAWETTYVLGEREHTAEYCGAALAHFFPNLDMRVLVTPSAKEMHYKNFHQAVHAQVESLEPVDIPNGADETELWSIFETVIDLVEEGDEVLFDFTHGFRSIPFLSFLAALYLQVVKNVKIGGLYYGNYEARDQSVTPNRAPVLELTPFISLLDWMIAADRFMRFGDSRDLVNQLRRVNSTKAPAADQDAQSREIIEAIEALESVSQALQLIRPYEAIRASHRLQTKLANAQVGLHQIAPPFVPLTQKVAAEYKSIALQRRELNRNLRAVLDRERAMVRWYLERKHYVQAVTVAREWLVSWAAYQIGEDNLLDKSARSRVERGITAIGRSSKKADSSPKHEFARQAIAQLPDSEELARVYGDLGKIRNDMLHAGKSKNAMSASKLEGEISSMEEWLDKFSLEKLP